MRHLQHCVVGWMGGCLHAFSMVHTGWQNRAGGRLTMMKANYGGI